MLAWPESHAIKKCPNLFHGCLSAATSLFATSWHSCSYFWVNSCWLAVVAIQILFSAPCDLIQSLWCLQRLPVAGEFKFLFGEKLKMHLKVWTFCCCCCRDHALVTWSWNEKRTRFNQIEAIRPLLHVAKHLAAMCVTPDTSGFDNTMVQSCHVHRQDEADLPSSEL